MQGGEIHVAFQPCFSRTVIDVVSLYEVKSESAGIKDDKLLWAIARDAQVDILTFTVGKTADGFRETKSLTERLWPATKLIVVFDLSKGGSRIASLNFTIDVLREDDLFTILGYETVEEFRSRNPCK